VVKLPDTRAHDPSNRFSRTPFKPLHLKSIFYFQKILKSRNDVLIYLFSSLFSSTLALISSFDLQRSSSRRGAMSRSGGRSCL